MRCTIFILLVSAVLAFEAGHAAELRITTIAAADNAKIPARLHLIGPEGKAVLETGNDLPASRDHVSSQGEVTFNVAPGTYELTAERGPEWVPVNRAIDVPSDVSSTNITVAIRRLVNLGEEGWWSGETHIHRPIKQAELLMRSEDLQFGQFLSWWNAANPWLENPLPSPSTITFDGGRAANLIGGEDERDGGALLFFNLERPVDVTAGGTLSIPDDPCRDGDRAEPGVAAIRGCR